jgi:CRP/FNR family transcriptional regulator, cyclic AMP receptor protein
MRTTSNGSTLEPAWEVFPCGIRELSMGFDCAAFLAQTGTGRTVVNLNRQDVVFSQDDQADTIFYIQKGQVELSVVSQNGKQAAIAQLGEGDFIGEECVALDHPTRGATATALMECTVVRIDKGEMLRALHEEPAFSALFVSYLLARSSRLEADLVQ